MFKTIFVGIDTGVNTGLAVWDSAARSLTRVETVPIHRAMCTVYGLSLMTAASGDKLFVVFEDARKRKWIPDSGNIRTEMGRRQGAGSVKRDSKIWEDFLKDYGIRSLSVKPQKGWTKLDPEKFKAITGYQGRTSEHARDAAMLVFGR